MSKTRFLAITRIVAQKELPAIIPRGNVVRYEQGNMYTWYIYCRKGFEYTVKAGVHPSLHAQRCRYLGHHANRRRRKNLIPGIRIYCRKGFEHTVKADLHPSLHAQRCRYFGHHANRRRSSLVYAPYNKYIHTCKTTARAPRYPRAELPLLLRSLRVDTSGIGLSAKAHKDRTRSSLLYAPH